jgi:hypothetical protein
MTLTELLEKGKEEIRSFRRNHFMTPQATPRETSMAGVESRPFAPSHSNPTRSQAKEKREKKSRNQQQ